MALPSGTIAAPLDFSSLGTAVLRMGDDDARPRPGSAAGSAVADLQRALAAVGTYTGGADGAFGAGTQLALRRFTWFLLNSGYRLRVLPGTAPSAGTIEAFIQNSVSLVTSQCTAAVAGALLAWVTAGVQVTSMLVRVPMARFTRIARSDTFTTLDYPGATDDEVLVNHGFVAGLDSLEAAAVAQDVRLRLNQTFRRQDVPPTGAVVQPATRSQHLIGQAADLNILDGATVVTSAMFIGNTATAKAKALVTAAKSAGLRWGGDFTPTDPPHFDSPVAATSEDYLMHFFFCQRCYTLRHPIRTVA